MTSEPKDYSKMMIELFQKEGASLVDIYNSSIYIIARLYCSCEYEVENINLEEQAEEVKLELIEQINQIKKLNPRKEKISIAEKSEKNEIYKETGKVRVQNLVDKFVKICESENMLDIIESVIIFFSATHLKYFGDSSIPLETHGENLKHDFIECCKSAKKITVH